MDLLVLIPVRVWVDGREEAYAGKTKRNFFNPCKGLRLTRTVTLASLCHKSSVPSKKLSRLIKFDSFTKISAIPFQF